MTIRVIVPSETTMRRYLTLGLTAREISERWRIETGQQLSPSTVYLLIRRYGLQAKLNSRDDDPVPLEEIE